MRQAAVPFFFFFLFFLLAPLFFLFFAFFCFRLCLPRLEAPPQSLSAFRLPEPGLLRGAGRAGAAVTVGGRAGWALGRPLCALLALPDTATTAAVS